MNDGVQAPVSGSFQFGKQNKDYGIKVDSLENDNGDRISEVMVET